MRAGFGAQGLQKRHGDVFVGVEIRAVAFEGDQAGVDEVADAGADCIDLGGEGEIHGGVSVGLA